MANTPAYYPSPEDVRRAAVAHWEWTDVWQPAGLCRTIDCEWFPDSAGAQRAVAKTCMGCPVRRQCLTWALENGEHSGVWGGLTERELRKTAGLTPQGTRRPIPATNMCCPWCKDKRLAMTEENRVKCQRCGYDWRGTITIPEQRSA